jgi:sulfur-carrier protein
LTTVRLYAAARAAAGVDSLEVDGVAVLAEVVEALAARSERMAEVLGVCSFLVDGEPAGTRDPREVPVGDVVDVLPPFAGG